MAEKTLKYFMRPEAKEEQIFEVPGPESIRDEKGQVVNLQVRKLHNDTVVKINDMYKSKVAMKDKKGAFIVQNGQVVFKTDIDVAKINRRLIVEALVYPNLKDEELMKFFDCLEITDMPLKVFPTNEEFGYVQRKVFEILGLTDAEEDMDKETEDAKNL